jgi:hypothetical protein
MDTARRCLAGGDEEVRHELLSSGELGALGCSILASLSLTQRSSSGQKLCLDLRVGADDGGVHGRCFPCWRHHHGLTLSRSMARALRVKTQALASRSGRQRLFGHLLVVGVPLVSQLCRLVCTFSSVGVGGRRGSGPGWWLCVEAAASGPMAGICFMVRSSCSHGLGDNLVSPVRRGCRLGRCVTEEAI